MGMKILYWNVIIPLLITGCQDSISVVKQDIPDNLVVLSFDDAREDNFSFVAPLLIKYGFGATFYICEFAEFEDTTRFMTWKQIKQLADMGFEIGNHTKSHRDLEDSSQKPQCSQTKARLPASGSTPAPLSREHTRTAAL